MVVSRLYYMVEVGWEKGRDGELANIQAGFRCYSFCENQNLDLVQAVSDRLHERPRRTVMTLLDISKTYDRVWRGLYFSLHTHWEFSFFTCVDSGHS